MKQFYETYAGSSIVPPLMPQEAINVFKADLLFYHRNLQNKLHELFEMWEDGKEVVTWA